MSGGGERLAGKKRSEKGNAKEKMNLERGIKVNYT